MSIAPELSTLVAKLQARYIGVRIVQASLSKNGHGELQQSVQYQAPLALLKHCGLLTANMVRNRDNWDARTLSGDWFILHKTVDQQSRPGCWDLWIYTETAPREDRRISVREAAKLLRRISKVAGRVPA